MKKLKQTLYACIFAAAAIFTLGANAQVPDVSKWTDCPLVFADPNLGVEIQDCFKGEVFLAAYMTVYGELVYVHEHRLVNGKAVYYNALKTKDGKWVEDVNERSDREFNFKEAKGGAQNGVTIWITDDNGKVLAERFLAPKK